MDSYHVFDQASNLVIQGQPQPRSDEPTGEPVSLLGKIDIKQFGEFAQKEKPRKAEDPNKSTKPQMKHQTKKKKNQILDPKKKARMEMNQGLSVLNTDIQEMLLYKPKTTENKMIYEQLLSKIQAILGDESQETLRSVTDEALAILKNDNLKDQEKKKELEGLISVISQEKFAELLGLSKQITDYTGDIEEVIENIDKYEDEIKFGVVFEDEGESESSKSSVNKNENQSDDEQEDEGSEQSLGDQEYMQLNQDPKDLAQMQEDLEEQKFHLDVSQIDAYWLETLMNQYFNDPLQAKKMLQEIMKVLNLANSMECENSLVSLLNYDKYDLIKLLMHNRLEIYYLTLLGQAQDKEEKDAVITEMQKSDEGQLILKNLEKVKLKKDTETENIAQVRREAALISQATQKDALQQNQKQQSKAKIEEEEQGLASLLEAVELDDEEFLKMNKKVIDLDSMTFEQGSHFMSNEKCQLPQGSYKLAKKGYDEVYVPAIKHMDNNQNLVKITSLPQWAQPAFPASMKELNRIQSAVYNTAFKLPENMLVCAPTGAGKTNIALLAILQIIGNARRAQIFDFILSFYLRDGTIDKDSFKIVYIAPMKALVNEMVGNFKNRLESQFGLTIRELTGDMQLSKSQIQETQIIVATPEKWDIITRKSGEKTYLEKVKLMVIDEVHLLHDSRGPVLEALVARTIRLIEQTQEMIRIIGLSATLPNFADVATFLRVDSQKGLFYFDHTYRPVPLEQQFIGITEKKAVRKMLLQNEILYEKVIERAGKFQMIIFVHTRKDTVKTARILKEMAFAKDELQKFLKPDSASKIILEQERDQAKSPDLKELLPFGFAVHHAGLPRLDRNLVEELFYDNHIQVLVSTATLAWGVNLPAHTVILKGTQVYSPEQGKWVELSAQDILQMIGRAGRPGMDTKGEGIIITGYQELKYYLSLLNQQLPIESQFISSLADQLNAEIVLGTVNSLKEAVNWLGYTYLYVRMLRAHSLYGIDAEEFENDKLLVRRRTELIHSAATLLDKAGLIRYERKTGLFMSTQLGKISSHYYIKHASMNVYNQHVKPSMGIVELFKVFSLSSEFKYIPIRDEEKVELQKLLESVPLPVKGNAGDPTTKTNVLLQAYISRLKMDGLALNADMVYVTQSASRIMRALYEIFLSKRWAEITETALSVCKMIDKRMWGCMTPLRQFKAIPNEIIRRIERNEALSWDHLYNMNANQIGELIKFQKLGKVLHKFIHQFPRLELNALVQPITRSCLRIDLSVTTDFQWDSKIHSTTEPFWIFVEDCDGEVILYSEFFVVKEKFSTASKEYIFEFTVPLFEPLHPIYYIKVISDRWLSCDTQLPISFKSLILPEKFSPCTELLDRQLLPTSTLKIPECEQAFKMLGIREFNSIQTQVFQSFFNNDESVFLGSSTGSGKTTCSLIALFRLFNHSDSEMREKKCVYIAPMLQIAEKYYSQWRGLIKLFGRTSAILTGNQSTDLKLIEKHSVIFTPAEYWDTISRRWSARKQLLQTIGLFIIDELHLLAESGSVLEAITSRIRVFTSQLGIQIRIVALASSIADYRDIAEWLGIQPNNTFNFHSNIRPVPLDVIIQPFYQPYRKARMLQMEKYLLTVITNQNQFSAKQQTIIFVPDRKQARLTALTLVAFLADKFLTVPLSEIQELIDKVNEKNLKHCLSNGVGILYEGIDPLEREIVEQLFDAQAIQTLVCTYKLSWEINQDANFVIIFDTQRYDGQERRYIDYTIPDILQMIGRTQHIKTMQKGAQAHNNSKCLVLCYGPKKDYYKKFLNEPYPVESHLNHYLADHLSAEVVAKSIKNKQDCVDWITWTFMYRRLTRNPNYYNLQEISGQHINDYISELIESVVDELEKSKCLAVENELDLIPLNLGIIASYYYIKHQTIETFSTLLSQNGRLPEIIELLSNAAEFEIVLSLVPIRHREEQMLKALCGQIEYKPQKAKFNEPNTKTNILLQCHFKRIPLSPDFCWDQRIILKHAVGLIQAIVDVISSNNWLKPAILAMQLSQMLVQACELKSSPLIQLPHLTPSMIEQLNNSGVSDIADFLNMEDADRNKIVQVNSEEMEEIANACNRYPNVSMKFEVDEQSVTVGDYVTVSVELERDPEDYTEFVVAPYYPKQKEENWWVMIGQAKNNQLLAIKRITFNEKQKLQLNFSPEVAGEQEFSLYLICDSYIGCDQKENFTLKVEENQNEPKEEAIEVEEN